MRFKFGEVYTVSVSPFFGVAAPSTKGTVSGDVALGFSCDPANSRGLIHAALQEICKLQARVASFLSYVHYAVSQYTTLLKHEVLECMLSY